MNFDPNKQAKFGMSPGEIDHLATLQTYLRTHFDPIEHNAVVKICQEIGCGAKTVELVNNLEWEYTSRLLNENNFESLIPIYCDMRIAPNGIQPLLDRMNELKNRDHDSNRMDDLAVAGQKLEQELQEKVSIDLNKVTNEQINQRVELMRQQKLN